MQAGERGEQPCVLHHRAMEGGRRLRFAKRPLPVAISASLRLPPGGSRLSLPRPGAGTLAVNETTDLSIYKAALLFLATAGVVAPLFFRLRISPVLGYLLAGVALGPYGLGSLDRRAPWLNALAINVEAIDKLAAFGVVALLFTMGLEPSFERLRLTRRLAFGLGLGQVVVTTLALGAVAWALGLPRGRGDDRRGARHVLDGDRDPGPRREQAARRSRRPGELLGVAVSGSRGSAPSRDGRRRRGRERARARWRFSAPSFQPRWRSLR